MFTRRRIVTGALASAGATVWQAALARAARAQGHDHDHGAAPGPQGPPPATRAAAPLAPIPAPGGYKPVVTPDVGTLPWVMKGGVKEFRLVAEPVTREFSSGLRVKCWGYNGSTPGPTIEAVEGDRVRILVSNRLPEPTSIHWHGILLPAGMDGVSGLNQPSIKPGETFAYEFTLKQSGTQMYHPHADEMLQMAVGMMGLFIIHPREPVGPLVDRDFAIMLHEWAIHPGTYRPDPSVMTDFNVFTFNGKVYPDTSPLVVRTGQRVRIRFGNLSMDEHPIHLHGFQFWTTGTDAGPIRESAQVRETTVPVPVGATRDIEFIADEPGDWIMHCHRSHHTMNQMGHGIPNTLGVKRGPDEAALRKLLPGYMTMGQDGMGDMQDMAHHMKGPANTLPMMAGRGPFGNIEMGGMFTILKVRDQIAADYADPGWYAYPPGTVAYRVEG